MRTQLCFLLSTLALVCRVVPSAIRSPRNVSAKAFIYSSTYVELSLSLYLSFCLSVSYCLSLSLTVFYCLFLSLSLPSYIIYLFLSVFLSVCASLFRCHCVSNRSLTSPFPIHISFSFSTILSVHLSLSYSLSVSLLLSLCIPCTF